MTTDFQVKYSHYPKAGQTEPVNYFQLLCLAYRPLQLPHPENTFKYNSSTWCLASSDGCNWVVKADLLNKASYSWKQAPAGFSLEYSSALVSFPKHTGILFSFITQEAARR